MTTVERLEILLQRQEILDCLTRFSRGMDRFDRELFLSAFHADATIAAGDFVGGPADLYAWASAMHEQGQIATNHNLLNHTCDIAGDTAHTETYYLFVGRNRDDTNWIAGGRYLDRVERREGCVADRVAHQRDRVVRAGAHHADPVRGRAGRPPERHAVAQPGGPVLPATADQQPKAAGAQLSEDGTDARDDDRAAESRPSGWRSWTPTSTG